MSDDNLKELQDELKKLKAQTNPMFAASREATIRKLEQKIARLSGKQK